MELHATLNQFRHAHCGKNTNFMGKFKRTSYMAVTVNEGRLHRPAVNSRWIGKFWSA